MIRVAIAQPDIRPFRLPVFNLLALQRDIDLTVFADVPSDAPAPAADAMRDSLLPHPVDQLSMESRC